jgi:hypothetical protein
MSSEPPPSQSDPPARNRTDYRGCLGPITLLLYLIVIPWYKGEPFPEILGDIRHLGPFLVWIIIHVGLLVIAYGVTILVIVGLFRLIRKFNERRGAKQAIDYIGSVLPVKTLWRIGSFFADSRDTLRQVLSGEVVWFGPLVALIVTVSALDGLQSLLGIPPSKASAADVIYHGSRNQARAKEAPQLTAAVPNELLARATEVQLEDSIGSIAGRNLRRLPSPWDAGNAFLPDFMRETYWPGSSKLGIYLESVYGIRTSDDLLAALPNDFSGRERIKATAAELEHTSTLQHLIDDGVMAVLTIPFAVFLWLGSGRAHSLVRTLGASAILWTMTSIVGTLVYISTAIVHMLWEAHMLRILAEFITLQYWVVSILPAAAGLSRLRSWLLGTGTFLVMQLGGGGLLLWYIRS